MTRILATLIVVAAVASSAWASPPAPLNLGDGPVTLSGGQTDTRIEKQSWFLADGSWDPNHTIINPYTGVSWDINDHGSATFYGFLASGASTFATWQHIWDYNPIYACKPLCTNWGGAGNSWGSYAEAPSPDLAVRTCLAGRCFDSAPKYDASLGVYRYVFCGTAQYTPDDPLVVDIPGSAGADGIPGRGHLDTITVTISNIATGKRGTVKNITVGIGLSSDMAFAPGCSDNRYLWSRNPAAGFTTQTDYPFRWFSS